MKPDSTNDTQSADQSTAASTANNPNHPTPSLSKPSDTPLLPHTASSALSTAASHVKAALDDALAWTEAKVEKLSAKNENGTGPYGDVSTCALSDLDPIGQGVLPAMPEPKKAGEDGVEREGKDEKEGDGKGDGMGKGEE